MEPRKQLRVKLVKNRESCFLQVFSTSERAARNWIDHDRNTRIQSIPEIMEHIRLPLIHPAAFCEEIEMDELMMTSMKIMPIMAEARKYHIMGVAGESKRFKSGVQI